MANVKDVRKLLKQYNGKLVGSTKFISPDDETHDGVPYWHIEVPGYKMMLFAELDQIGPYLEQHVKNKLPSDHR
jgi:hypothetical protein